MRLSFLNTRKMTSLNLVRTKARPRHPPSLYLKMWNRWAPFGADSKDSNVDWEHLLEQVRLHPSIARYCDEERLEMFLLHFVCALQPPLEVVEAVMMANPEAISKKSLFAEITPLMVACGRNASPQVIRRLVKGAEETILMTNADGYAAIHWACREDVAPEVVHKLLQVLPEVANQCVRGERVRTKEITPVDIVSRSGTTRGSPLPTQWKKIVLFLRAQHYGNVDQGMSTTLHAALALRSCDVIVRGILECDEGRHPFIGLRDEYGHFPLHYAVRWHSSTDRLLFRLLSSRPDVARIRDASTLKLPLHEALISGYGWNEGIKELFLLHKPAIYEIDLDYKLYPFALAAAFSDLDATFNLLRQYPNAVAPS
jgi:Ankyrin repeat